MGWTEIGICFERDKRKPLIKRETEVEKAGLVNNQWEENRHGDNDNVTAYTSVPLGNLVEERRQDKSQ